MRKSFSLSVPFEATSASKWRRCKLSDKRRPWDKSPFEDVDMMRQQTNWKSDENPASNGTCPKRVVCRAGIHPFPECSRYEQQLRICGFNNCRPYSFQYVRTYIEHLHLWPRGIAQKVHLKLSPLSTSLPEHSQKVKLRD